MSPRFDTAPCGQDRSPRIGDTPVPSTKSRRAGQTIGLAAGRVIMLGCVLADRLSRRLARTVVAAFQACVLGTAVET